MKSSREEIEENSIQDTKAHTQEHSHTSVDQEHTHASGDQKLEHTHASGDQKQGHAHTSEGHVHEHGGEAHFHPNAKAVSNRLAKAIGHLESVKRMVDRGEDCSEVLIQLAAVRSAINNAGKVVLMDHLNHCIVDAVEEKDFDKINEFSDAIQKFVK